MKTLPQRAQELIKELNLSPHPEGGFYRETYRSGDYMNTQKRHLMTSIYFLLTGTNISRFHRISSDETWYFHEGTTLLVHTLDQNGHQIHRLGTDLKKNETPFFFVPKNTIFGSSVDGDEGYTLVSCAVAPGFDFADFELFEAEDLMLEYAEHAEIIQKLT